MLAVAATLVRPMLLNNAACACVYDSVFRWQAVPQRMLLQTAACTMAEVMAVGTNAGGAVAGVMAMMSSNPTCGTCLMGCASAADMTSCAMGCAAPAAATTAGKLSRDVPRDGPPPTLPRHG